MVSLSDCLLELGGNHFMDSVESLALTVYQRHDCCYKFYKFLNETECLGQATTKRALYTLTTIKMIYNTLRGKHILLVLFIKCYLPLFLNETECLGRATTKRALYTLTTIKMIYNPFRGKHILLVLFIKCYLPLS